MIFITITLKKYAEKAQLFFFDTDSLTYHIKTDDGYSDFYKDKHLFGNTIYSVSVNFIKMKKKKKLFSKFKDVAAGNPIT